MGQEGGIRCALTRETKLPVLSMVVTVLDSSLMGIVSSGAPREGFSQWVDFPADVALHGGTVAVKVPHLAA